MDVRRDEYTGPCRRAGRWSSLLALGAVLWLVPGTSEAKPPRPPIGPENNAKADDEDVEGTDDAQPAPPVGNATVRVTRPAVPEAPPQEVPKNVKSYARVSTTALLAATRLAVAEERYVKLFALTDKLYEEDFLLTPEREGYLVGVRAAITPATADKPPLICAVQPVWRTTGGDVMGEVVGEPAGMWHTAVAQPGYALAGMRFKAAQSGWQMLYMKINDDKLDPDIGYRSDWLGVTDGPTEEVLVTRGAPLLGLWGHAQPTGTSIGLLQLGRKAQAGAALPDEPDESKRRPADAKLFGRHYYKLFDEKLTWAEARLRCVQMGGHLATLTSESEDRFVRSLAKDTDAWIGGTDLTEEGRWVWVTGESFSYTNWNHGEPNNALERGEFGLQLFAKGWNDMGGFRIFPYVCEWER